MEEKKPDQTTHVRVWKRDRERLIFIKENVGFKNVSWVIHSLLEEQAKNLATVEVVMNSSVPVVLTGKPLSGKTFFIKQKLLPFLKGSPVLVIDSWSEYAELRNIGYELYSLDLKDFSEHIRFVPNMQSRVAITEVGNIFAHLDMKRNEMPKWIIVVEEAHTFKNVSVFTKFLYGSRHIVRKMIVITPQTDAYEGLVTLTVVR